METKIFDGKEIKTRKPSQKDLKNIKKFQNFINSLIKEDAQIALNQKVGLRQEKQWLLGHIKNLKKRELVFLLAENNKKDIVGTTEISLGKNRQRHVGNLGIIIRQGYRGIGLGNYLMAEIIKLAKKELKPRPKIIKLKVFPTNKPALGLYKKFGFKEVARIPKQIQYRGKLIDEMVMLKYL